MKTRAKPKRGARRRPLARRRYAVRRAPEIPAPESRERETYTQMETGQPDSDEGHGHGPLDQEGEGEAQNDQLAALEGLEPKMREEEL